MRKSRAVVAFLGFGGALGALGCGGGSTGGDLATAPTRDLRMVTADDLGDDSGAPGDGGAVGDDGGLDLAVPSNDFAAGSDLGGDDLALPDDGGQPDLAAGACLGTMMSCGLPGQCTDCSGSTVGTACVGVACGCNLVSDCPIGNACDPNTHQCSPACAGGAQCNGGCCDGQRCQGGNANGACGNGGGLCLACGGGTPTCQNGLCGGNCGLNGMGPSGTCGNGFCCGANNQCQAISNLACGTAGGACSNCVASMNGPVCLGNGTCGCNLAKDCAPGQSCKANVCGTVCDANTPCNGGCCASGKCAAGNTQTACALGGALCGSCAGNMMGLACVTANGKTACGCSSSADCALGQACNTLTHVCGTACDVNSPCNGGCCTAAMNGVCAKGVDVNACGNTGGVCAACINDTNGHACVPVAGGGQCGCTGLNGMMGLGDCPIQSTLCDVNKHLCVNSCGDNMKCQTGCCSAHVNGTCQTGSGSTTCGLSGICADCTNAVAGHQCVLVAGLLVCGCAKAGDCPMGNACDPVAHACTTKCSVAGNQLCNGGCCGVNNTCAPGTAASACGAANTCLDCTASVSGHVCVNGSNCGCNQTADCGLLQACDLNKHLCVTTCTDQQLCNGGCCLGGSCVAGTQNAACGGNGKACGACKDGTPTCIANACAAKCGGMTDGICGNNNCCAAGQCVTGTAAKTCGFSGACIDCTNNSVGTACLAANNGPNVCGCKDQTNCLPADPANNIGGYACDKGTFTCTSLCGIGGNVTICNGGCCSGAMGTCLAGGNNGACGISGGFCANCTTQCNPGPICNPASGQCGCSSTAQCETNVQAPGGGCGPSRLGCNLATSSCCIKGGQPTNNKALCCSGNIANGLCSCIANGMAAMGGDPTSCCSLNVDGMANCACRPGCKGPGCTVANLCTAQSDCCNGSTCTNVGNYSQCQLP